MRHMVLLLSVVVAGRTTPAPVTRDEFIALEQRRSEAIRTHDLTTLRDYYPEGFTGIASNGRKVTRDELFTLFERVDPSTQASLDDLTATPAGPFVLVSAKLTLRSANGSTSQSRLFHVYRFEGGKWRMVTGQSTPIVEVTDNQTYLTELRETIRGRETLPAEQVFKNVRVLPTTVPGVTAERLLRIMDLAYSRGLGVACSHCHVVRHWEDDSKTPKTIARAMSRLTTTINRNLLGAIPELKDRNPAVSCPTCHRGQLKPALTMQP